MSPLKKITRKSQTFIEKIVRPFIHFEYSEDELKLENLFKRQNRFLVYKTMESFYKKRLPSKFLNHRKYFLKDARGFGEDAFHSMWYLIFSQYQPINCLEIGVYRGQTVSLWGLLAKHFKLDAKICGISPFLPAGDAVSSYRSDINYLEDTNNNFRKFKLQTPEFCISYSDTLDAHEFMNSRTWDLIYIDGSHDYNIVANDLIHACKNISNRGLIIMDDSSLYFGLPDEFQGFHGHPGPSKIALSIANALPNALLGGVGHNNIFKGSCAKSILNFLQNQITPE